MFEFLGAITGRAIIKEGRLNYKGISGGLIGLLVMIIVSLYAREDFVLYIRAFLKYTGSWFFSSIFLGIVSAGLQFKTDYNPKTSAWPSGPHLHPIFQALRELLSGLLSLFYPPDPKVLAVYNRLDSANIIGTILVISLFLIAQGYVEDYRWQSSLAKIKQRALNNTKDLR